VTGTSGFVDPQFLINQATRQTSTVLRVDNVTAKRATMSDFMRDTGDTSPSVSPGQSIWVVAIRGDIRIDALIDLPHAQCALFAYDAATGDVRALRSGPPAICDPYFK
jgi:membrane carboxypeptidase/penicillin-binding protein